jgi:tRNA(Ile)-lysidine synthase
MKGRPAKEALLARMEQTIARHDLFIPGQGVLVAVSGGVDSMVMLHALQRLGYPVAAAHFDHQTREGVSAEDAAFVRESCKRLGIPCYAGSEPVAEAARTAGQSFEGYARVRRYAFLVDAAKSAACSCIATAHHEDDQAETMLMGVLGMASSFGGAGMTPVSERDGIRLVRPLLHCARTLIEDWARQHCIEWREDSSNRHACCVRNRVRLELLPLLETYSPRVRRVLSRSAALLRTDGECLDALAADALDRCVCEARDGGSAWTLNRQAFLDLPEALRRRVLKRLAINIQVDTTYERIVSAVQFIQAANTGKRLDLGGGATLRLENATIFLQKGAGASAVEPFARTPLNLPGQTAIPGHLIVTRLLPAATGLPEDISNWCLPTRQYFDADKIDGDLYVRSRRPGDRMTPLGMEHARKVQDIMVDLRIPSWRRDAVPLLTLGDTILWMAGYRRSNHAAVNAASTRLLEVELHYADL